MSSRKSVPPLSLIVTTSTTSNNSVSGNSVIISEEEVIDKKYRPPTPESPAMDQHIPSRPLSVAIPQRHEGQSSYCPRRPNLSEILANTAPPPWTLSAFMAYLSQNHCLETLEFTMDATRYRKHYQKASSRSPGGLITSGTEECTYIRMLWQRLVEAYIAPNGPREVNLPGGVRDGILLLSHSEVPPPPAALDAAVEKVYELMEDSVLVPFLNSFYPAGAAGDSAEALSGASSRSYNEREQRRRSPMHRRPSPPLSSSHPDPAHQHHNRASAPATSLSQFARTLSQSTRHTFSHTHSHSASTSDPTTRSSSAVFSPLSSRGLHHEFGGHSPADSGIVDLTEGSASSPSAFGEPMTPPTTPPMAEFAGAAYGGSPTSISSLPVGGGIGRGHAQSGPWKKMRSSLGFKKRGESAGVSFREDDEMDYQ